MNIFLLHESPILCARYHCDKHVVKMVNEYAQLLATAHRVLDGHPGEILRPHSRIYPQQYQWVLEDESGKVPVIPLATHHNHPCAIWARDSSANYTWLYCLYQALSREFAHRYQHSHGGSRYLPFLRDLPLAIPVGPATPWPLCVPDELKIEIHHLNFDFNCQETTYMKEWDPVGSYRNYYIHEKLRFCTWKNREPPPWVPDQMRRTSAQRSRVDTMIKTGHVTGSGQRTLF